MKTSVALKDQKESIIESKEADSLSRPVPVFPVSDLCATQGALSVVQNIGGLIPVVHASKGCAFVFKYPVMVGAGNAKSPRYGGFFTPTTNLLEKDIIMGGEEKVYKTLQALPDIYEGIEGVFILTGCTGDIIGDDLEKVCRRAKPELSKKGIDTILFAETGGFKGTSSYGANIVLNKLCNELVESPKQKLKNTVNVFGVWPYFKSYWCGEIEELKRIFSLLNINVNAIVPGSCHLRDIKRMSEASLNVVISGYLGVEAAQILQEKYGTPYIVAKQGVPVGAEATTEFFMEIAQNLSMDMDTVKKKLEDEERTFYKVMEGVQELYALFTSQTFAVIGEADYNLGFMRFLSETLGFYPVLTNLTTSGKGTEKEVENLLNKFVPWRVPAPDGKISVLFDPPLPELQEKLDKIKPNFIVGRSIDRFYGFKTGTSSMVSFYPCSDKLILNRCYMGYRGAITLTEDIFALFGAPMA